MHSMEDRILIFALCGLFFGFLLPFVAGRFGKLVPADPGEIILRLFHKPRFPVKKEGKHYQFWLKKEKELLLWAVGWSIMTSVLFSLLVLLFPENIQVISAVFVWIIEVCIIIDAIYWLLPDFYTIPLLLLGICFSLNAPDFSVTDALVGAIGGYLVSVVSVIALAFSPKKQLGCGDVKMITALGAWLGLMGLSVTLILFVFYHFFCFKYS